MKKKLFMMIMLSILLLPFVVFAEDLSVTANLECENNKLKQGESTTCTLSATTNLNVNVVEEILLEGTNLTISDVKLLDSWKEYDDTEEYATDKKEYSVMATNKTAKKGTFKLATFKVTTDKNVPSSGTTKIKASIALAKIAKLSDIEEAGTYDYIGINDKTVEIKIPVTDNTLSSLKYLLTDTKISVPDFSKDKTKYEFEVDTEDEMITFFTETTDPNAKVEILPNKGTTKKDLELGLNTFAVNVYNDAKEAKLYTVVVNRKDPRELSSLEINGTEIELTSGKYDYPTIKVKYDVKDLTVLAELEDPENNEFVTDLEKEYTKKSLSVGINLVSIKIKNEELDGEREYTVLINRLDENGRDTTVKNTDTTTNPKTFGGEDLTLVSIALILGIAGYVLIRKKSSFPNV